ncbi:MAG: ELM1/GtrOC1 family putative glycosyltransferase, partial [Candidatus Competibacterales bacterium]
AGAPASRLLSTPPAARGAGGGVWRPPLRGGGGPPAPPRLVYINRPNGLADFDLVVVPPQYGVPPHPNVLRLALPLQRPRPADPTLIDAWRAEWAAKPTPWIAVLVGGATQPLVLDGAGVDRLMAGCRRVAEACKGTLLLTTSPRTPAALWPRLEAWLRPGDVGYRWRPDAQGANPYAALLALAHRFVVTADSVSMATEVVRTGKPLAIAPLPARWSWGKRAKNALQRAVHGAPPGTPLAPWRRRLSDAANGLGLTYYRDLEDFRRHLIARGWAEATIDGLGDSTCQDRRARAAPPPDDLERVAATVRQLFCPRQGEKP